MCPNLKLHKRTEKEGLVRSHWKIITIASGFTFSSPRPKLEGKITRRVGASASGENDICKESGIRLGAYRMLLWVICASIDLPSEVL